MKKFLDLFWPLLGFAALTVSCFLLYQEFRGNTLHDLWQALISIPVHRLILAFSATLAAYWALAWYDRIALLHLGHKLGWSFISLVSFTTYALSHNIGASVFSGGVVRYRAYSTKGLSVSEVAILVAFCSFTFAFGMIVTGGVVFTFQPELLQRLLQVPQDLVRLGGLGALSFVMLYLIGSALHLRPLVLGKLTLTYPRLPIALRQLVAGPLEILGAAAIIWFALPDVGNPGYFVVLGIFVATFSVALLSQTPGGLGVIELLFVTALPDIPKVEVLAALIVFRLFYLIIPLVLSLPVIALFEKSQFRRNRIPLETATQKG
jgi:glycosyltransferase 2 family protein